MENQETPKQKKIVKFTFNGVTRRFKVSVDNVASLYNGLQNALSNDLKCLEAVQVFWVDDEGDEIFIISDADLQEAISHATGDVLRIIVKTKIFDEATMNRMSQTEFAKEAQHDTEQEQHPLNRENRPEGAAHGAVCDICDRVIIGHRFRCLMCSDYDLCQLCESTGVHGTHAMMRIVDPNITHIPWGAKICHDANRIGQSFQSNMMNSKNAGTAEDKFKEFTRNGIQFLTEVGSVVTDALSNFGIDATYEVRHDKKPFKGEGQKVGKKEENKEEKKEDTKQEMNNDDNQEMKKEETKNELVVPPEMTDEKKEKEKEVKLMIDEVPKAEQKKDKKEDKKKQNLPNAQTKEKHRTDRFNKMMEDLQQKGREATENRTKDRDFEPFWGEKFGSGTSGWFTSNGTRKPFVGRDNALFGRGHSVEFDFNNEKKDRKKKCSFYDSEEDLLESLRNESDRERKDPFKRGRCRKENGCSRKDGGRRFCEYFGDCRSPFERDPWRREKEPFGHRGSSFNTHEDFYRGFGRNHGGMNTVFDRRNSGFGRNPLSFDDATVKKSSTTSGSILKEKTKEPEYPKSECLESDCRCSLRKEKESKKSVLPVDGLEYKAFNDFYDYSFARGAGFDDFTWNHTFADKPKNDVFGFQPSGLKVFAKEEAPVAVLTPKTVDASAPIAEEKKETAPEEETPKKIDLIVSEAQPVVKDENVDLTIQSLINAVVEKEEEAHVETHADEESIGSEVVNVEDVDSDGWVDAREAALAEEPRTGYFPSEFVYPLLSFDDTPANQLNVDETFATLLGMGYTDQQARRAISHCGCDLENCIDYISQQH